MADEYKNFNEYEKAAVDEETTAPVSDSENTSSPDPNPPTGWAPGHDENNSTSVAKSSGQGVLSIILSLLGYCFVGIPSFIGIFVAYDAYKRNKFDVTAKVGLTACILMTILWIATIAFYIFTPAGREAMKEILEATQEQMNELYSSSDIYSLFK